MKKKKKKRVLPLIVILAVIVAAALVFANIKNRSKTVDVYPVSNLLQSDWNYNSMDGVVTEGRTQNITLKEGIVDQVLVSEGQSVKAGDVLMKYDTESFKLTLKSDEAKIASLESGIKKAKEELEKYKGLIPSEYAPVIEPRIIHHTAPPVDTLSEITSGTAPSKQGETRIYYCTADTVVRSDFLKSLYENGSVVELRLYNENVLYATWTVDGSTLGDSPYAKKTSHIVTPEPTKEPEVTTEPKPAEDPETSDTSVHDETAPGEGGGQVVETIEFDDWILGGGVSFNGDGTANIDFLSPHYGTLDTVVPEKAEWDEIIEPEGPGNSGENYIYSKKELAKMIEDKAKEIESMGLDLRSAKLTYEKDKLTYDTGEVKAAIDGVVTDLKDVAELNTGGDVMKIKGTEKAVVDVAVSEMDLKKISVGDTVSIIGYESGTMTTAEIKEIGTEPMNYSSYGIVNPNNSFYPAKAYVDDENAELKTNENCQVTIDSNTDSGGQYLPNMYIRSDNGGKYVMADDNGKLVKKYVKTGKSLWGYATEIKSGIDGSDKIAFPYGKTVKEGVRTKEAEPVYY